MKNRLIYLIYAVLLNAFGTALMAESNLGMSAWGSAAINVANYSGMSLGLSFNIIAVFFYILALIIMKQFNLKEAVFSFGFALSFGFFTDLFIYILPNIQVLSLGWRIIINIIGLLIMCMGIAIHLRINLAVHPMDVYLGAVQRAMKSIAKGTYLAYGSAFLVALLFGYLSGELVGIGIGTANTLVFAGLILAFYDKLLKI